MSNGRHWSNSILKELANSLPGFQNAINVSGFLDSDKAGGKYEAYFDIENYVISKYGGDSINSNPNSAVFIDLDSDVSRLDQSCLGKYNLVFSHTVLEHVKNPFNAFKIFKALMAPDSIVVNVVPFIYKFHFLEGNYGDYWRYTPHGLGELHESVDLKIMEMRIGPSNSFEKYIVTVGSNSDKLHKNVDFDYQSLNEKLGDFTYLNTIKGVLNKMSNSVQARIK